MKKAQRFPTTVVGSMPRPLFVRHLLRPETRQALGTDEFTRRLDTAVASQLDVDFLDLISALETEMARNRQVSRRAGNADRAILVPECGADAVAVDDSETAAKHGLLRNARGKSEPRREVVPILGHVQGARYPVLPRVHQLQRPEIQRGDAVVLFMTVVGTPPEMIEGMRQAPVWPMFEAVAPTLA